MQGLFFRGLAGFNPRSRAGSDLIQLYKVALEMVSIHAPARGATFDHPGSRSSLKVSIHAPARGATYSMIRTIQ